MSAAMRKKTGGIQDRGTSFRIRYTDVGGLRHEESYKTREEAERELAIRMGELATGKPVSATFQTILFGELATDVLTDYEINGFASVDDQEARFRLHLIPRFGQRKVAQITTPEIKRYIKRRQREGAKNGTINRELELMRHTFNLAIQGRKILHAAHVPMLREDNTREGFFTREEVERLCRHLKPPTDAFVMFAFLTGWRYGEIRKLKWNQVDFAASEIRIHVGKDKSRAGRVFPMHAQLRKLLKGLARTSAERIAARGRQGDAAAVPTVETISMTTGALFVFGGSTPIGAFRKSWNTACYKAGIPCTVRPILIRGHIQKGKAKVLKASRTFHDLRRSFARESDRAGVRQAAIMKLGGWKTDSVFRRYNIVSEGDLRDAMQQIEQFRRNGPANGPKRRRSR